MVAENIALTEAVYYILLSLYSPLHGYGIMQKVEDLSAGRVRLAAGTLYGALNTLLEKGWINTLPGKKFSRKKEYIITVSGKKIAANELMRLRELLSNGEKIIEGESK
jgi:DNA-binding PadR family transcriptional regulator